ncbi:helix-turn-helix domain-containing protein [Shewanella donghaensis]|uniref:helix-turn-helix domain-containing protein n=1 Tax=Shewanella donghaensis TaxID=238836 RepID=UPI001182036E|nr:AraC family transcriptional regulator [Shewanella donghaensis]
MDFKIGFNEIEIDALENKSVEAIWTYYNVQDKLHHIVPDGRSDIIFTFDVRAGGELSNIRPIISPPFTKAHPLRVTAHQGFIGLRLRAGSAGIFLNIPLSKISGHLQYGKDAVQYIPWAEKVCKDKSSVTRLITNINQHVSKASSQVKSSMVADVVCLIHEAQGITRINEIAQQIKISERTINRVFTNAVGLSPKQFSSIIRLRRAIDCLNIPDYAVSSIALDCGFADQAHMTREIKSYMGQTPSQLQKALDTDTLL